MGEGGSAGSRVYGETPKLRKLQSRVAIPTVERRGGGGGRGRGRDRGAEGPISRQAESQSRIVQSRVRPLWHNARSRGGACHVLLRHGFTLTLQLQPSSVDPAARANNINLLKFAPSSLSFSLSLSCDARAGCWTENDTFESNSSNLPTRVRSSAFWIPSVLLLLLLSLFLTVYGSRSQLQEARLGFTVLYVFF